MRLPIIPIIAAVSILFTGCAVKKYKDLSYIKKANPKIAVSPQLNVFTSRNASAEKLPV